MLVFCSADFFLGLAACLCRYEFCPTPFLLGFVMFLCRHFRGVEVAVENPCGVPEPVRLQNILGIPAALPVQDLSKKLDGIDVTFGGQGLAVTVESGDRRKN